MCTFKKKKVVGTVLMEESRHDGRHNNTWQKKKVYNAAVAEDNVKTEI